MTATQCGCIGGASNSMQMPTVLDTCTGQSVYAEGGFLLVLTESPPCAPSHGASSTRDARPPLADCYVSGGAGA
eukprot:15455635-Alexandrium_andersonii.AAC.1